MSELLKTFPHFGTKTPLYISLAGITYPDADYRIIRSQSNLSVIEYVVDGAGYIVLNDGEKRVEKDTVYFLPRGMRHEYYADKETPFTKIFLNITGTLCTRLALEYGISDKTIFSGIGLKNSFLKIHEIICSDMSDGEMQATLQGILVEIMAKLSIAADDNKHNDEAMRLKNHLDANIGRIVTAKELAKVVFRSPDYCQKLFSAEYGTTPYAYQIKQKMLTAKSLLTNTNLSVGEIAGRLGYGDIHYFSNLFLQKCGCRPSEYRKSKR